MALSSSSTSTGCRSQAYLLPSSHSLLPLKSSTFNTAPSKFRYPSIVCKMAATAVEKEDQTAPPPLLRPDSFGRFGKFGGKYVPETLMHALTELEEAFNSLASDHEFQVYLFSSHWHLFRFFL